MRIGGRRVRIRALWGKREWRILLEGVFLVGEVEGLGGLNG